MSAGSAGESAMSTRHSWVRALTVDDTHKPEGELPLVYKTELLFAIRALAEVNT